MGRERDGAAEGGGESGCRQGNTQTPQVLPRQGPSEPDALLVTTRESR